MQIEGPVQVKENSDLSGYKMYKWNTYFRTDPSFDFR
jgi:hypothetical protein